MRNTFFYIAGKGWECIEIAGDGLKWLEMAKKAGMARNGLRWLETAGNGVEWLKMAGKR